MSYVPAGATPTTVATDNKDTYLSVAARQRIEYLTRNGYAVDLGGGLRYPNMTFADARGLRAYWVNAWMKHYTRNWRDVSWGSTVGNYQIREYFKLLFSLDATMPANPTGLMKPKDAEPSSAWVPADRVRRFWDQVRPMASDLDSQGFVPSPWSLAWDSVVETVQDYGRGALNLIPAIPAWAKIAGIAFVGLYVYNTIRR
jgi:hypothetical protein